MSIEPRAFDFRVAAFAVPAGPVMGKRLTPADVDIVLQRYKGRVRCLARGL